MSLSYLAIISCSASSTLSRERAIFASASPPVLSASSSAVVSLSSCRRRRARRHPPAPAPAPHTTHRRPRESSPRTPHATRMARADNAATQHTATTRHCLSATTRRVDASTADPPTQTHTHHARTSRRDALGLECCEAEPPRVQRHPTVDGDGGVARRRRSRNAAALARHRDRTRSTHARCRRRSRRPARARSCCGRGRRASRARATRSTGAAPARCRAGRTSACRSCAFPHAAPPPWRAARCRDTCKRGRSGGREGGGEWAGEGRVSARAPRQRAAARCDDVASSLFGWVRRSRAASWSIRR